MKLNGEEVCCAVCDRDESEVEIESFVCGECVLDAGMSTAGRIELIAGPVREFENPTLAAFAEEIEVVATRLRAAVAAAAAAGDVEAMEEMDREPRPE